MARNLRGWGDALRGQELCRGPARRETDSPAASQISGACGTVSYPEWCVQDPLLPSLTVGQGHPPWHPMPSPCILPHSPGTFYHLLKLTSLLLFCWGWANRGSLLLELWKRGLVTQASGNVTIRESQKVTTIQQRLLKDSWTALTPRKSQSEFLQLLKLELCPFIEYADTCKAYGSKIYITQPKAG